MKNCQQGLFTLFVFLFTLPGLTFSQGEGEEDFDAIRVNPFKLPVSYDMRQGELLSPVKTQATGGCWSGSVMATVEPWWRLAGLGDHWFSDRNLQLTHGFTGNRNTYGNHFMATAYFSRGGGPVEKNNGLDSVFFSRPQVPFILADARYLPGDPALIKQTILDFGPVYTMLYFKRTAVDTVSYILASPDNPREAINHAVALVGWNDTVKTAEGEGVWIVQNSLGVRFGDSGFFYVPYQNRDILKYNAVWNSWDPFDERNRVLYNDTLGSFESYGFDDSVCYGLTRFTADTGCRIIRLASHINMPGTFLSFEVYSHFNEKTKKLNGKKAQTEPLHCLFPGYYTCDLAEGVNVKNGEDFYVLARYSAPMASQPLPVESAIEDYSDPHLTSGRNWVNPNMVRWPEAWYECGQESPYPSLEFDLCIRAIILIEEN